MTFLLTVPSLPSIQTQPEELKVNSGAQFSLEIHERTSLQFGGGDTAAAGVNMQISCAPVVAGHMVRTKLGWWGKLGHIIIFSTNATTTTGIPMWAWKLKLFPSRSLSSLPLKAWLFPALQVSKKWQNCTQQTPTKKKQNKPKAKANHHYERCGAANGEKFSL